MGGDGAKDLKARLVKAGASEERMAMITTYPSLVEKLKEAPCPIFALPNYTAMMELRSALNAETGNREFWE